MRNDWTGFDKSVPEFSGEDEHFDLSQFIFVIETNINQLKKIGYEISEEQIAYSIVNKLKPNSIASSYYINYMKTQAKNNATPSWQSIKEHLGNLMNSASKQLDLRSKLRRLKAGNSITKYNNEFMKISAKVEDIEEIDLVSYYLDGLDDNISSQIKLTMNTQKLTEVMNQAVTRYNALFNNSVSINYANSANKQFGRSRSFPNHSNFSKK